MPNAIYVGDSCLATVEEDIIAMHYCGMCGGVCVRVHVCVCERERGKEKAGGDTLTSSDSGFQLSKASFNSMSDVFLLHF